MNIFYIDNDPQISAICMVDSHVVKMILETAQMLSTAHRIVDNNNSPYMYKATHINHPSTKWARETEGNYIWLVSHFKYLGDEYQYRYGKIHKSISVLYDILIDSPKNIPKLPMTKMPCAIPKEYIISDDPVENYRNYYIHGKSHLHKWTKRNPPEWLYISK